jgi:hypothetical protein
MSLAEDSRQHRGVFLREGCSMPPLGVGFMPETSFKTSSEPFGISELQGPEEVLKLLLILSAAEVHWKPIAA